ncbi:hypothetical protein P692DRAFT_20840668 [Suillus brevipes Sb2]|nr:hypothetical protein P692DRAFT_20840668 [Suillus brevipes Sb2]
MGRLGLGLGSAATPDSSFLPLPHSNRAVIRLLDEALHPSIHPSIHPSEASLVAHPM